MAVLDIENPLGFAQIGTDAKIAEVTADGANTVTVAVADVGKFRVGQRIIFRVKATGAGFGTNFRTITGITNAGVLTYDGADIAVVPGTHAIYDADAAPYATNSVNKVGVQANGNSGSSAQNGYDNADLGSVQSLRDALTAISSTSYTSARLDLMTKNDMEYAVRIHRTPTLVRGY